MILSLRLFPWFFLVSGGLMLFFGGLNYLRGRDSVNWPTTQGVVTHASVEHDHDTEGNSSYSANVEYRFQIDGTTYHGNRISYGDYGSSSPSHAKQIITKYPQEKKVTVCYMPDDPEVCVLEPGLVGFYWFVPAMGLVFFTVGVISVLFLLKPFNQLASQISKLNSEEKNDATSSSKEANNSSGN